MRKPTISGLPLVVPALLLAATDPLHAQSRVARGMVLDSALGVAGLDPFSPERAAIFRSEKRAALNRGLVYLAGHVEEPPRRLSAPPLAYPPALLRRHVQGFVEVAAIIDTLGRVEPASLEMLSTPDSALLEPVKQMMLESRFSPGRAHGLPARVMVQMAVEVRPPRLRATELVTTARAQLAGREADSALATLEIALDSVITHPTEGERAFALLVRGVAWSAAGGRAGDSAASADFKTGLDLYERLISGGVDLAPLVRRLADSVRLRRPETKRARRDGRGASKPPRSGSWPARTMRSTRRRVAWCKARSTAPGGSAAGRCTP